MKILLIEDEVKTLLSLQKGLEEMNWNVEIASDGASGSQFALDFTYDVIVSDIILPDLSGLDLCRLLREKGIKTPVLLLSALSQTDDKIQGLEAGADDYLAKPFEFKELVARIKALSRRQTDVFKNANILKFADLELNLNTKTAIRNGKALALTPREFALLEYFVRNEGRVISKTEISEKVWDLDFDTGTNVVEVYINYLRNKVDKGFEPKIIHTQFGQGYILTLKN